MEPAVLRDDMVEGLEHPSKGVLESEALSIAMRSVPRHEFVSGDEDVAYTDRAFDHRGTTVLSPSLVARLLEALDAGDGHSVLVVGAGVGYTPAVLAEIAGARHVSGIDLSRRLVMEARRNLARTGYEAVFVDRRDGADGLPEYAPYDRILVEAAAVQPPRALIDQLAPTGRLVMPLGLGEQELVALEPSADGASEPAEAVEGRDLKVVDRHGVVRFKPLLVDGEQAGGIERNRTAREEGERAARAAKRRGGWEQDWIDWDARL